MKTIKFSHEYPKLWGQRRAKLIHLDVINPSEEMCSKNLQDLLEYDTKTNTGEYYELPSGDLIQLVFLGEKNIPFCTLRRYTNEKYAYYSNSRGEVFDVEVKNG